MAEAQLEVPRAGATGDAFLFSLGPEELRRLGSQRLQEAGDRLATLVDRARPATVENFLAPLDTLLLDVHDVSSHGSFVFQVHPDAPTRTAGRELSEEADRFFNAFRMNERVYASVREVDLSAADAPTRFAVEKLLREMRRAGVEKDAEGRARLLDLQNSIDRVSNQFAENIAKGERELVLESAADLTGLPPDFREAHPAGPDGKVRISTKGPDARPVLAYAERADVRRRMQFELMNRAHPTNLAVLDELFQLRHDLAVRLGYPTYAAFALEDKMTGSPRAAHEFLDEVAGVLRAPAAQDLARFLERKRRDDPGAERVELWDVGSLADGYYDGKIRREEFGVDAKELRRFLPYPQVRDGLFQLCRELFDLEFVPVRPVDLWHDTVEAFDVRRNGSPVGRMYLDLTPREGKFNHAACFTVRVGTRGRRLPQNALVCNFLDAGTPVGEVRMQYSDVVVFFHEFGHLLHGLLSGHGRWLYNTMSMVEWDFVEAPSLLFEEWARDPSTLARFASDPSTGEPIPRSVLERLSAAERLGRAAGWLRQVALSAASLEYYDRDPARRDTSKDYRDVMSRYWPYPYPEEYHPQESWGHLTGYSAFYYTYVWSLVIARDLLTPFHERGALTDRSLAERYAQAILEPGSQRPARELVRAFLGRPSQLDAFRQWVATG